MEEKLFCGKPAHNIGHRINFHKMYHKFFRKYVFEVILRLILKKYDIIKLIIIKTTKL